MNATAKKPAREYLVIREIATDELRIAPVAPGYRPKADPGFTWGGPFKSLRAARAAIAAKGKALRRQLYPTPRSAWQPGDAVLTDDGPLYPA
jgi:hypothetical protein